MSENLYTPEDATTFYEEHFQEAIREDNIQFAFWSTAGIKASYRRTRIITNTEFRVITTRWFPSKSTIDTNLSEEWFKFLVSRHPELEQKLIQERTEEKRRKSMRPEDHLIGFTDGAGNFYPTINDYYKAKGWTTAQEEKGEEKTL